MLIAILVEGGGDSGAIPNADLTSSTVTRLNVPVPAIVLISIPLLLASALALGVAATTPGAGVQVVALEDFEPSDTEALTSEALFRM